MGMYICVGLQGIVLAHLMIDLGGAEWEGNATCGGLVLVWSWGKNVRVGDEISMREDVLDVTLLLQGEEISKDFH